MIKWLEVIFQSCFLKSCFVQAKFLWNFIRKGKQPVKTIPANFQNGSENFFMSRDIAWFFKTVYLRHLSGFLSSTRKAKEVLRQNHHDWLDGGSNKIFRTSLFFLWKIVYLQRFNCTYLFLYVVLKSRRKCLQLARKMHKIIMYGLGCLLVRLFLHRSRHFTTVIGVLIT